MSSTNRSATIVFGNCAGVARGEKSNPEQLGRNLRGFLSKKGLLKGIVAVGLAEVLISTQSLPRCTWSGSTQPLSPYEPNVNVHLDDLSDFQTGFEHNDPEKYYLSHLNSRDHCHKEAIEGKWCGSKAAERIVKEFNLSYDVYQGTGTLLFNKTCESHEGLQLRPAGENPLSATTDNPLEYRGNRNSEPRSAIVFRELSVLDDLKVDLVFCQLETNNQDPRIATREKLK